MCRTTSFLGLSLALLVASRPVDLFASDSSSSSAPAPGSLSAQASTIASTTRPDVAPAQTPTPPQTSSARLEPTPQETGQPQDTPNNAPPGAATGTPAPAAAQPTGPPTPAPVPMSVSSGGEIGFYNKYLWRGFVLADATSMQPTYWVKFANTLTVSSWMNVSRAQLEGPLTEHDLTVDYSRTVAEKWTVSGGWINYVFPGLDEASVTNEVYAGVSHASWLNPTVRMYVDFHEGDGTYFNFSVNHTFALSSNGFAATPSLALGYNHDQWIDKSTWSDLNVGVKLNVPTPISRLSLAPALYYSKALTDAGGLDDHVVGGISIVTKF